MRILLKLTLACEPDTAWAKLHRPSVFSRVMAPLMRADSQSGGPLPTSWQNGDYAIRLRLFGVLPMGEQTVRLRDTEDAATGVRMLTDTGFGTSGALTLIRDWRHRMAVSALPDRQTLYRDELRVHAGWLTPLVWPGLWLFWQWRGFRLRRLAHEWSRR